jgi:signal transduction histidine kinase
VSATFRAHAIERFNVLETFEQVDSSRSRKQRGTGLGLPLLRAMMALRGGTFELRSDVGAGTKRRVFPRDRMVCPAAQLAAAGIAG